MPIISPNSGSIIANNARASDVAQKAIGEILPVQQQKALAAFKVQGYQGILYSRLHQGAKCNCQSSQKQLNTKLGLDGKADPNLISSLITGANTFTTTRYGTNEPTNNDVFIITSGGEYDSGNVIPAGGGFGDNGPLDLDTTIDSIVGEFDASTLGWSDAACAVCFGTGYIGGYSPFHTHRTVITVTDVTLTDNTNTIDFTDKPFSMWSPSFSFKTVFPKSPVAIDVFRLMYKHTPANASFTVDSTLITSIPQLLAYCDGKIHTITVQLQDDCKWTHVELQFNLTTESAWFELPKLSRSSDTSILDSTEPFQIVLSPNIPIVRPQDVVVESTFGKTLIVQNVNFWNTRERNIMGWECNVRVIQPQELYRILPQRGRILIKPPTSVPATDHLGNYRT